MTTPTPLEQLTQAAFNSLQVTLQQAGKAVEAFQDNAHQVVEQSTETIGKVVTPIAENPILKFVAQLPMLRWLLAALGQVDMAKVQQDIQTLRQQHLQDSRLQLAQRVIQEATLKAAGMGLVTNIVPPVALTLFALDIAAVSALQAEMLYRIAALYDLPLADPARRGEVLTIYGLSVGGTSILKTALSVPELIPGVGAVIGASSDAALVFVLGQAAMQFYERKTARSAMAQP